MSSKGQLYKCTTVRRRTEGSDYDSAILSEVTASYYKYITEGARVGPVATVESGKQDFIRQQNVQERSEFILRRIALKAEDYAQFDYTAGCPGRHCMETRLGPRRNHSEQCRERIESALAQTEEGRERLERAGVRIARYYEENVKEADMRMDGGEQG